MRDIAGFHRYNALNMNLDDNICYCYHVSLRKLINFAKRRRPSQASRMTECLNAGTGCGWCIPFLVKIAENPDAIDLGELTPQEYAEKRKAYRGSGCAKNKFKKSESP